MTQFSIVYCDPPWQYADKASAGQRGASFKYPVMPTAEICAMGVPAICADDCVLFLWATFPMFGDALRVMQAWGFRYSTVAWVWVKTASPEALANELRREIRRHCGVGQDVAREISKIAAGVVPRLHWGMGQSTRANAEPLLMGIKGRLGREDAGVHQVVMHAPPDGDTVLSPVAAHSEKPAVFRDLIVQLLGDRPKVELFARHRAPGWAAWGDQAPGGSDCSIPTQQSLFSAEA